MCCLINLKAFTFSTPGEVISSSLTVLLLLIVIFFPMSICFAVYFNYEQLKHPNVENTIGEAYSDLKLSRVNDPTIPNLKSDKPKSPYFNKKNLFISYAIFYYLRRVILGLTVIYLQ